MKTKKYRVTWRGEIRVLDINEIKCIVSLEGGNFAESDYWKNKYLELEKNAAGKMSAADSKALKVRCMNLEIEVAKLRQMTPLSPVAHPSVL